jgi:hypothetical protein
MLAPFGHAAAVASCLLLGKNGPGSDAPGGPSLTLAVL